MQLLDPSEIKEEKKENIVQTQKRTISLAKEEARINREINLTKQNAEIQKTEIKKEVDDFIEKEKARATDMVKEVDLLELRKAEALKPVAHLKKELEEKIKKVDQTKIDLEVNQAQVKEDKDANLDLAETLSDRVDDLDTREEKIAKSETKNTIEQTRLKNSGKTLSNDWIKLHEDTHKANTELKDRESKLNDIEKVLAIRSENQDKREVEQNNHDRAIRDKYETLARTMERIKNDKRT